MFRAIAVLFLLVHFAAHGDALKRSGFLGVQAAAAPEGTTGVVVRGLVDGGSAKDAGLQADDRILRVDGRAVEGVPQFVQMARSLREGDVASLDVARSGRDVQVRVPVKPRPFESAPGLDVAYASVDAGGFLRRTILLSPRAASLPLPAILFVTGVGCFSQEISDPGDNVAQLLHGLTRAGFITMRVEKSGAGDSQGSSCNTPEADLQSEVRGYVAGLRALKQDRRVDPDKVFLVGLSLGGVEAPLIEREEKVRGVVAINTAAKPFFEYIIETRRRQLTLRGMSFDELDRSMARVIRCNTALLVDRRAPDEITARMPECRDEIAYPAPHTLIQQWAPLNMAEAWKKTSAPVLVVAGRSDYVATFADSPYLVEMLNSFNPGRATLRAIEGMDHFLARAPSMKASMERGGEPGEFEPAVLEATTAWLKQQLS